MSGCSTVLSQLNCMRQPQQQRQRLFRLTTLIAVVVSYACIQPLLVSSLVYRVHRVHRDGYYHASEYAGIASSMTTPLLFPRYSTSSSSSTATSEATVNQRVIDDEGNSNQKSVAVDVCPATRVCHDDESAESNSSMETKSTDRGINSSVVSSTSRFIIDSSSPSVSIEEVSNSNLIMIVNLETTDEECNKLCWYYLLFYAHLYTDIACMQYNVLNACLLLMSYRHASLLSNMLHIWYLLTVCYRS
jgi:hypothetical protein